MSNKHLFIAAHANDYMVSLLCRLPDVSRSRFYRFRSSQPERQVWVQLQERRDQELLDMIGTIRAIMNIH